MEEKRITEACRKILGMFESGQLPKAIARTVIEEKCIDKPSSKWSLANRLLMLVHETNDARGYKQWEQVGRYVKRGAKAFYILAPVYKTVRVKKKETDENGNEIEIEKDEIRLVGFKPIPVFRYEDTEGKPIETPDYKPRELPPLINVAEKFGVKIAYGPFAKKFYGYYRPGENSICFVPTM